MNLSRLADPESPQARVAAVAALGALLVGGCSLSSGDDVGQSIAAAHELDTQRAAQVRDAVRCEHGGPDVDVALPSPVGSSEPATRSAVPGATAREAMKRSGAPAGLSWQERRIDAHNVLFTGSHRGRVRVAVTVIREGSNWMWDTMATCDQAELPPASDADAGMLVWSDAQGRRASTRTVHTRRLSRAQQECHGERVQIVVVDGTAYVADPLDSFAGRTHGRYRDGAMLPEGAVDTGLRSEGARLWRSGERDYVYLVDGHHTRRLARLKSGPSAHC